jgi:hypothetical protein
MARKKRTKWKVPRKLPAINRRRRPADERDLAAVGKRGRGIAANPYDRPRRWLGDVKPSITGGNIE